LSAKHVGFLVAALSVISSGTYAQDEILALPILSAEAFFDEMPNNTNLCLVLYSHDEICKDIIEVEYRSADHVRLVRSTATAFKDCYRACNTTLLENISSIYSGYAVTRTINMRIVGNNLCRSMLQRRADINTLRVYGLVSKSDSIRIVELSSNVNESLKTFELERSFNSFDADECWSIRRTPRYWRESEFAIQITMGGNRTSNRDGLYSVNLIRENIRLGLSSYDLGL
jgi:hypothetical protein